MVKWILGLCVLVMLALPDGAVAAKPRVTQAVADAAATQALDAQIGVEDNSIYAGVVATGYDSDRCEVGRREALCDFTMSFDTGDVCDGWVEVSRSRRGRLLTMIVLDACDSDLESEQGG